MSYYSKEKDSLKEGVDNFKKRSNKKSLSRTPKVSKKVNINTIEELEW